MVRPIVIALIAFVLIALVGLWLLSGGPRRVVSAVDRVRNNIIPSQEDLSSLRLPWQPVELFPTLDITNNALVPDARGHGSIEYELAELQAEYERLETEASNLKSFGTPSVHAGKVRIVRDTSTLRETTAADEYVQLVADYSAEGGIDISGWSLESALSRTRAVIVPGASPFVLGEPNALRPIAMYSGMRAIISTGPSPVGISFRENMCTGYLAQFQRFAPPLDESCPTPSSVIPLTEENLARYGDACFDFVANLSSCTFPQSIPQSVYASCRAYLSDALSHNGCVNSNRYKAGFEKDTWRLYLGGTNELWRNSHDAIRLLDASGRTVDVFVY
jgi:hypothetical protein